MTCPGIVDDGGWCAGCGHPVAVYAGKLEHKRGRWHDDPAVAKEAARRSCLARMRAAELDPTLCECGRKLDGHPPLGKPTPWEHGRPCGKAVEVSIWTLSRGEWTPAAPQGRSGRDHRVTR
jgi:hypothetical protein